VDYNGVLSLIPRKVMPVSVVNAVIKRNQYWRPTVVMADSKIYLLLVQKLKLSG